MTATITPIRPTLRPNVDVSKSIIAGIKATALAASTDAARPIVTNVLITIRDGVIKLVATDSYMLFVTDLLYHDMPIGTDLSFMVRAKDLVAALPKGSDRNRLLELDVTDSTFTICDATSGATSTIAVQEGTFPDWRSLITSQRPDRWYSVAFNPKKLAVIAKAADIFRGTGDDTPLIYTPGGTELKPQHWEMTIIDRGTFYALFMPVRIR